MLAQTRQIHHEGIFELTVNILLHGFEIIVLGALVELAAEDLLPIRSPLNFVHRSAADQRQRTCHGRRRQFRRNLEVLVVERKRLVVVVDLRHVRIGKDVRQDGPASSLLGYYLAALLALPATLPALLILPVLRIADTRLGLDIVEPGVLHALARGPNILACHRAGVTPDAFVEVQHHRDLRTYLHDADSSTALSTGLEWSSHSTLFSLRTMTNSSRFEPTVP